MSYLANVPHDESTFPLFAEIKRAFGFIPNFYRAQTLRTDLIEAEAQWVYAALIKPGALSRKEKEYVFLVCSAANLNTYCVTAHCEIVRMLKIDGPEPELVALDYHAAALPVRIKALLNYAVKLNNTPHLVKEEDVDVLRTYGYSDQEILETISMVAVARMASAIAFGVGAVPDFENPRVVLTDTKPASTTEEDIFA